jgi:hypothetical protein
LDNHDRPKSEILAAFQGRLGYFGGDQWPIQGRVKESLGAIVSRQIKEADDVPEKNRHVLNLYITFH